MHHVFNFLWRNGLACLTAVLLVVSSAFAGGFSIYEQGARATAQGGAFVARPWDPSAGFYNPAGLAMFGIPGQWRFYAGITPVQSLSKFRGSNPYPGTDAKDAAKTKWFPPFFVHGTYQVDDKMAVGLSITTPYGLGTEWKDDFSGRYRSLLGDIQVVYISPTFSYKVTDQFSVGAAVDYIYSKVALKRRQGQTFFNGSTTRVYDVAEVELKGTDGAEFGFHLGGLYKVDDNWSVGVDYKHLVHNTYEGTAKFKQITHEDIYGVDPFSALVDQTVASNLNNPAFGGLKQDGNANYLNFPNSLVVGVGYKTEKWSAEVDFAYVGWSTFKQIQIEFPDNQSLTSILDQSYDNAWQIRVGGEYWFNERLAGRLGYIFDKTPAPANTISPLLPDTDRHDIGIGLGYKVNDAFSVDVSYLSVNFLERSTKNNVDGFDGTYNSHVNLFSVGMGYTFGAK
ncbi:MAG: outer membrane protein transport protein [Bacteroidetes bacterium]|nr:outer membrane protein transport protein [Bacteroidota bacterium]